MTTKNESQKEESKKSTDVLSTVENKTPTKEVENSVAAKPARRRKGDLQYNGPLGGTPQEIEVNGTKYRTYWAEEGNPKRPNRVFNLTTNDDYELVSPEEVGGMATTVDAGYSGTKLVLLKKPLEYHLADTEAKVRRNEARLKSTANETDTSDPANLKTTSKLSMKQNI